MKALASSRDELVMLFFSGFIAFGAILFSLSMQMGKGVGFIQRRTCNEIWNMKWRIVYCKQPPIIKLEWDLVEVYCKRIQLRSSFWGENYVYLLGWESLPRHFGLCGFYSPCLHCLNEYLHSWNMELLVLMVVFYCLPTTICSLMPIRYSLVV